MNTDPILPAGRLLLNSLAENWWILLLRGLAAIAFGLLAVFSPGATLLSLTFLWGIYVFADGILALGAALMGRAATSTSRWWLAAMGVVGILAGIYAFAQPTAVAQTLLILMAIWAIFIGLVTIWGAIQLRKEVDGEWMLIAGGVLAVLFGISLVALPAASALALVWTIGIFAVLYGINHVALAFKVRGLAAA